MQQVYIAGPIAAETQEEVAANIARAGEFAERFLELGWSVVVPHTMYQFCRDRHARETFLESDFVMVARADAIFLCPGWENSAGTLEEIEVAKETGTTILKRVVPPRVLHTELPDISEKEAVFFSTLFEAFQQKAHANAKEKGWWKSDRGNGEAIALMHSELSEALEADRAGNPPDDKIPEYSGMEAEFADTIIRILDLAGARGLRVGAAIVAKMAYNRGRAYKHGGKEY